MKLTNEQLTRMAEFGNDPGREGSSSVATELLAARALLGDALEHMPVGYPPDPAIVALRAEIEELRKP
jgi:hypothetical protein